LATSPDWMSALRFSEQQAAEAGEAALVEKVQRL
jgi:hypothetical protein